MTFQNSLVEARNYNIYIFMNDLSCFYVIRRILLNHESCKSGSIKIIPC